MQHKTYVKNIKLLKMKYVVEQKFKKRTKAVVMD